MKSIATIFTATLFLLFTNQAQAQIVTNGSDSGSGSLREAISSAAAGAQIVIGSNVSEIMLEAEININKNLTIVKDGPSRVKINRLFNGAIFKINNAEVTFSNVNIANGNTINGAAINLTGSVVNIDNCLFENNVGSGSAGKGGAIYVGSNSQANINNTTFENNWSNSTGGAIAVYSDRSNALNINSCLFENNRTAVELISATPGAGGAIYVSGNTTASIANTVFRSNIAAGAGGAIWSSATGLNISQCSFNGHIVQSEYNNAGGGAIYIQAGTANIEKSAIYDNDVSAPGQGGGIAVNSNGTLNLSTSTIGDNRCQGNGGGIYSASNNININACTISRNSSEMETGGLYLNNGGSIKNTIVSTNNSSEGFSNISGNIASLGYNIFSDDPGSRVSTTTGDQILTDPRLGNLQGNGGTTLTFRLLDGSPAYNAGDPSDNFSDQINQSVFAGRRDIGAYESQEILSSTTESLSDTSVKVYPNPASDVLTVEYKDSFENLKIIK